MATFNTDTLIAQGFDHREIGCQDYALAGTNDYAIAVVSDGCSGSFASDVGARVLATTAAFVMDAIHSKNEYNFDKLMEGQAPQDYPTDIVHSDKVLKALIRDQWYKDHVPLGRLIIETVQKNIFLSVLGETFLDATLVLAVVTQDEYHAHVWGDGTVVVETGDGIITTEVNFPSGCPYYLSYLIDQRRQDAYFKQLGSDTSKLVTTKQVGNTLPESSSTRSILAGDPIYISGFTSNLRNISVMSDGMTSFMDPTNSKRVGFDEIWKQFDFNGFMMNGKFLKRKHNLLNRYLKSNGIVHLDDISVATIHVKP